MVVASSPPVPDPTVLTTEQLLREVQALKDLLQIQTKNITDVIEVKFESIETQLALIERQRVEQKADTKAAVDAALAAAKEAVKEQTTASQLAINKSESSTKEQLSQLAATFSVGITGVSASLNELKERVGRAEAGRTAGRETISGVYALGGFILTIILIFGGLAAAGVFAR